MPMPDAAASYGRADAIVSFTRVTYVSEVLLDGTEHVEATVRPRRDPGILPGPRHSLTEMETLLVNTEYSTPVYLFSTRNIPCNIFPVNICISRASSAPAACLHVTDFFTLGIFASCGS